LHTGAAPSKELRSITRDDTGRRDNSHPHTVVGGMRALVLFNMHVNETPFTKPVAEHLSSAGYPVERLHGYFKRSFPRWFSREDQTADFVGSLLEVKEKSRGFDLIVDLHGPIVGHPGWFPSQFSCTIFTFDRPLHNRIKNIVRHLWDRESFLTRLRRRFWTDLRYRFDRTTHRIVQEVGIAERYIEVEVFVPWEVNLILEKLLKQL
jgi:hypothetical protein